MDPNTNIEDYKKYYDYEDSDELPDSSDEEREQTKSKKPEKTIDAKGELQGDDNEDEDDTGTSSTEFYDSKLDEEESIEMKIKYEVLKDATNRLAIVNCDWEKISAIDLLVIFRSFAPKKGFIKSVTIYPSEFGLQKMQEENEHGPSVLRDDKKNPDQWDYDEDDDEDRQENFDPVKLRKYELEKMK